MSSIPKILYWFGWFLTFVILFIISGGLLGGMLFVSLGWFTHPELDWTYRWLQGVIHGAQYFGIWSVGVGIVLCFIKGHNQQRMNRKSEDNES